MTSVQDVAAYVIGKQGSVTSVKLQKLVYYSQVWSLIWDDTELFEQEIQAWANGPVVWELFNQYRGLYTIDSATAGDSNILTKSQRDTIDQVLESYGSLSARQLSHLTHAEAPWREARRDLPDTASSSAIITLASIVEYYGALDTSSEAANVNDIDWGAWAEWETPDEEDQYF